MAMLEKVAILIQRLLLIICIGSFSPSGPGAGESFRLPSTLTSLHPTTGSDLGEHPMAMALRSTTGGYMSCSASAFQG